MNLVTRVLTGLGVVCLWAIVPAATAEAQSLGTFSWQFQPYCNRLTATVVQTGAVYVVDGFDDQCGSAQRVPVVGLATPNLDGTIAFGLNLVNVGGTPVHIAVRISLPGVSGTWHDSQGQTGAFVFGAATGGAPRPTAIASLPDGSVTTAKLAADAVDTTKIAAGAVGAADVNANEIQRRVTGGCAAGQLMTGVNTDGTVVCAGVTGGAGGDITAVTAGSGLTGGGTTGSVSLAVAFAASGAAATAARSDHTHAAAGTENTAVGTTALAANATGADNVAVGWSALRDNTSGASNTAVGAGALFAAATGNFNTAVGAAALEANAAGTGNTALGVSALASNGTGNSNTVVGLAALAYNVSGSNNIAIGASAGGTQTTGSNNIYVGAAAPSAEGSTMRLGAALTRAFMAGVRGVTPAVNDALPVVIDSAGQLGTVTSLPLGAGSVTTAALAADAVDTTKIAAGAVGATDVNGAQVQLRVGATCAAGTAVRVVNQDGTVTCEVAGGDIAGVTAGTGLTGGGTAGTVALAVNFAGPGAAAAAARSDHTHAAATGSDNTAIGALALATNSAGFDNIAIGTAALRDNTSGGRNTAVGAYALQAGTTGFDNTAIGEGSMATSTAGGANTAVGSFALGSNTGGNSNTALGQTALAFNTSGSDNVAIGTNAGSGSVTGSSNIYLAAQAGSAAESSTIRIGAFQSAAFIAGVSGQTSASGVAVFVNSAGRLGTTTSSARFKDEIETLGAEASSRLQALRPVRFVYKPAVDDGLRTPQYGLIAEEVGEAFPELLVRDAAGQAQTVRYHFLAPLLVAEVQRLERERATLADRVAALERMVASLAGARR